MHLTIHHDTLYRYGEAANRVFQALRLWPIPGGGQVIRVPLNHMIFVGDGYTDIPCFSLVKQAGGVSIAVFDKSHGEKWGSAYQFVQDGRVSNLLSANYAESADLSIFLGMAVKKLATDIAVASGTYQG